MQQFSEDPKKAFDLLRYLTKNQYISWWKPEFTDTFERAELTGLYTLYTDGRDLVYYNFKKERGIQIRSWFGFGDV